MAAADILRFIDQAGTPPNKVSEKLVERKLYTHVLLASRPDIVARHCSSSKHGAVGSSVIGPPRRALSNRVDGEREMTTQVARTHCSRYLLSTVRPTPMANNFCLLGVYSLQYY